MRIIKPPLSRTSVFLKHLKLFFLNVSVPVSLVGVSEAVLASLCLC